MAMMFAPARTPYMPQLDGLRALAVFAVMVEHWVPDAYRFHLPWGSAGVHLFFVLSGFLITGILLDARSEAAAVGQSSASTLWRFYARRFLRIFPLYYLAVVVAALLLQDGRDALWPNLLYVSNLTMWHGGQWAGATAHFWSLAVEEQFYLAWPFVLLMLPTRALRPAVWLTILIAPTFRVAMALSRPDDRLFEILPVACLDALGLGAMLALLRHASGDSRRFERICLWVGLPMWVATRCVVVAKLRMPAIGTLEMTAMSLVFAWVIGRASVGFRGVAGATLRAGPLVYLGSISYGLYVIHGLLELTLRTHVRGFKVPAILAHPVLSVVFLFGLTVLLASASWWLYERPINKLKRFFPYVKRNPTAAVPIDPVPR